MSILTEKLVTADPAPTPTPGAPVRSEALLPADASDPNLQVAEEVAFDLQSDDARRVGSMPRDTATTHPQEALAKVMAPEGGPIPDPVEGAVPAPCAGAGAAAAAGTEIQIRGRRTKPWRRHTGPGPYQRNDISS